MADKIRRWLDELGLDKYADAFAENDIDDEALSALSDDDFKELGVSSLGHRKKLRRAIDALSKSQADTPVVEIEMPLREVIIPEHIANRITTDAELRQGERKFVTVLFADIYQSTALTEDLDPEEARNLLDGAIDRMAAAVHRYDGIVNKVLGDGVMALFGAPLALEDHAVRACYAAMAMQDAMRAAAAETRREFGAEIQARIGLHSGEVLVRAIKNDFGIDYDATGSAVHIASRMEQSALPGSIRLSHDTWRLVRDMVDAPSLGPLSIKGLSAPLEVYKLREMGAAGTRPVARGRNQSPFVGRHQNLSLLQRVWQSTVQGRGQAVVYSGEAGVGKSRLYQEFADAIPVREGRVLRGGFPVHGNATPFQGLVSLLSDYFGIIADDSHDQLRERLSSGLAGFANTTADLQTPLLALFQAPTDDDEAWRLANPVQRRRRTLNALVEFFSLLASRTALTLIFEDLQRADADSLALLDELMAALADRPILLLLNHRNEFTHSWPDLDHCQQYELTSLEANHAGDLLGKLLGEVETLDDLKRMLIERSGGNPLFLEEAIEELVASGALAGTPGRRTLTTAVDSLQTPGTVQGIIAARIDHLAAHEKEVLQTAAVFGDEVPLSLLEKIAENPANELRAALARLNELGYLLEAELFPDIVYRFKNVFIQQVTYGGILKSRRRLLHAQLAAEIENRYDARAAEVAEVLAHHFEQGGVRDAAIKYLLLASEKAEASFQYSAGATFCDRAALLAADHEELQSDRCLALRRQGDLLSQLGDWKRGNELYDQARDLAGDDEFVEDIALRYHNLELVEHEGLKLSYLSHGAGDEVLLFVSPGAYNQSLFQPLIPAFCRDYHIVTVRLLGQEDTDPPRPGQSIKDNARDIAAVAASLGRRVSAIGISRASNMLAHAATENPDLFKRLILVGPMADDGMDGSRFPRSPQYIANYQSAVAKEDWPQAAKVHATNIVPKPEALDIRNMVEAGFQNANRDFIRRFLDPDPMMDITGLVAGLQMPVLLMHGTADTQTPFAASEYLAERIPNCQLYAFEDKGHLPMQTATKEFCGALRNFLIATR